MNIFKKLIIQSDFFTKLIVYILTLNTFLILIFFIYALIKLKKKEEDVENSIKILKNKEIEEINESFPSLIIKVMWNSTEKFKFEKSEYKNLWNLILLNYLKYEHNICSFFITSASVATLIGLLGTVWGIVNSFMGIASAGSGDLSAVAPGIAEALITTMSGLFVAIPALIFNSILKILQKNIYLKFQQIFFYFNEFLNKKNKEN